MNYQVSFDNTDNIVKVVVTGDLDNDIRKAILHDVDSAMKTHACHRAIIDLRQAVFNPSEPMEGAVELIMYMSSIHMKLDSKLAFVYSDAEDQRKMFEKFSRKFGYQLRYFKDPETAQHWLLATDSRSSSRPLSN
ncbi:MAG: hypothetical protein C0616_07405 [Desulfuromonas sp.]|nr:MAG: hypothetical protein C0616_07405 [Desulfuromonas sp.]